MPSHIGTLDWMKQSGGTLQTGESRRLLLKALLLQLKLIPEQWLHQLGLQRAADLDVDFNAFAPPDSAAAKRAESLCREASPEYLLQHCNRSYLWARLLASLYGLSVDAEVLYVAAMLHDMGLTEQQGAAEDRPACFSSIGAERAGEILDDAGWDAHRRDIVCEAITLHLNLAVELDDGPEAHLLNQATALDTTGLRLWKLQPDVIKRVIEQHPRLGQNAALATCWRAEAQRFPDSRAGWLEHRLKFSRRLASAPFAE